LRHPAAAASSLPLNGAEADSKLGGEAGQIVRPSGKTMAIVDTID
jgi:hypothetical protein